MREEMFMGLRRRVGRLNNRQLYFTAYPPKWRPDRIG
jgi:hypothetical protein